MVLCESVDRLFSTATLMLIGLIIDGIGAIVISGFSLRPVNKLGRMLWPPYRKITSAWDTLHEKGEVSSDDYGFDELTDILGSKQHVVNNDNLKLSAEDIVFSKIKYNDGEDKPYVGDSEIEIILREAEHIDDTFSITDTSRMERETAIVLTNDRIEGGFLRTGAVLLAIGFAIQIYAQSARVFSLNILSC